MRTTKKILAILLSLCMVVSLTPTLAWAEPSPADQFISDVAAGGTVTLTQNIQLSSPAAVGKDVTVDLAGHTITVGSETTETAVTAFAVTAGALTIRDGSNAKSGKITVTGKGDAYGVTIDGSGGVVLESGSIEVTSLGGDGIDGGARGICANAGSSGSITVKDGTIVAESKSNSTSAYNAYAVGVWANDESSSVNTTTITVTGGSVSAKAASKEAYAVRANGESGGITVTGGYFKAETSDNYTPYAVYASSSTDCSITGGYFSDDKAKSNVGSGYQMTVNEEDATKEAYPYTVVPVEYVTVSAYLSVKDEEPWKTLKVPKGISWNTVLGRGMIQVGTETLDRPDDTDTEGFYGWGLTGDPTEELTPADEFNPGFNAVVQADTSLYAIWLPLITEVDVNSTDSFVEPKAGETAATNLTGQLGIPQDALYSLEFFTSQGGLNPSNFCGWTDQAGGGPSNIQFENNHRYYLMVMANPNQQTIGNSQYPAAMFPMLNTGDMIYIGSNLDTTRITATYDGTEYEPYDRLDSWQKLVFYVPFDIGTAHLTNKLNLHFNGHGSSDRTIQCPADATLYEALKGETDLLNPSDPNGKYVFAGWFADEDFAVRSYMSNSGSGSLFDVDETEVDLYAKWLKVEYIKNVDLIFHTPKVGDYAGQYQSRGVDPQTGEGYLYVTAAFRDKVSGESLDRSDRFKKGTYTAVIDAISILYEDYIKTMMMIEDGGNYDTETMYVFATEDPDFSVKVNNKKVDPSAFRGLNNNFRQQIYPVVGSAVKGATALIINHEFTLTGEEENEVLANAKLTAKKPVAGRKAAAVAPSVTPKDADEFIAGIYPHWYEEEGFGEWNDDYDMPSGYALFTPGTFGTFFEDTFVSGDKYGVVIKLQAKDGYYFMTEEPVGPGPQSGDDEDGDPSEEIGIDLSEITVNGEEPAFAYMTGYTGYTVYVGALLDAEDAQPTPDGPIEYTITIEESEDGIITSSKDKAKKDETVTLTVELKDENNPQEVVVTDKNGNEVPVTKNDEDGSYNFKMPAGPVTVSLKPAQGTNYKDCPKNQTCPIWPFKDSNPKEWYHDGVHWAIDEGIMNGIAADKFAPNDPTTRAMIVTMLWRLEGSPEAEASGFTDLEAGSWYEAAVNWAAANEIVKGYNATTFGPTDPVTREQLATILYRYSEYKGTRGEDFAVDMSKYTDFGDVSDWAVDAVTWCVGAGIINGMTETTIVPQGTGTRAQMATMLMRYSN